MLEIPNREPKSFRAGDTVKWKRDDLNAFPAGTWTLAYHFVGPATFTVTATADSDDFAVTIDTGTTEGLQHGRFKWQATVTDGNDRFTVGTGAVEIMPDLSVQGAGFDDREFAEKALQNVENFIVGKAQAGVAEYEIGGRKLKHMTFAELRTWRDYLRAEVNVIRRRQSGKARKRGLMRF